MRPSLNREKLIIRYSRRSGAFDDSIVLDDVLKCHITLLSATQWLARRAGRNLLATFLRIPLESGVKGLLGGVIGGVREPLYFHQVNVVIENNWTIPIWAGFMKNWPCPRWSRLRLYLTNRLQTAQATAKCLSMLNSQLLILGLGPVAMRKIPPRQHEITQVLAQWSGCRRTSPLRKHSEARLELARAWLYQQLGGAG